MPANWAVDKTVLGAAESLEISDRARVSGTGAVVAYFGCQSMRVGVEAYAPSIWSSKGVNLADRSHVLGSIEAGAKPVKGNGVQIQGPVTVRWGAPNIATRQFDLKFGACQNHVNLEPNETRAIGPSFYGNVSVKRAAVLHLFKGEYSFESLAIEPGGRVEVHIADAAPNTVQIAVKNSVTLRGPIVFPQVPADVELLVAGSDVVLGVPFTGTVIAPSARVTLDSAQAPYKGAIYGRSIYVAPDVRLELRASQQVDDLPVDAPDVELEELDLPTTAGPAPDLLDDNVPLATRASTFMTWVQHATPSDMPAVREAVGWGNTRLDVVNALVGETANAIASMQYSRALVALEVLAELQGPESEAFLTDLVQEPAPTGGLIDPESGRPMKTVWHELLQAKAVMGLGWIGTEESRAAVRDAAVSHPSPVVAGQAVRSYVLFYKQEGQQELLSLLPESRQWELDRYETINGADDRNIVQREQEYRQKHPESVVPPPPIVPENPTQVCPVEP